MTMPRPTRATLIRALLLPVAFVSLGLSDDCDQNDIFPDPGGGGGTVDAQTRSDYEQVVLTFEPAGPFTVNEAETITVRVAGRRRDTGALRPLYEATSVVRASDPNLVSITKVSPGSDGAHDGIGSFEIRGVRPGTVTLNALLDAYFDLPATDVKATAQLTVVQRAAELRVTPAGPLDARVGDRIPFEFRVVDAAGNPIPGFEGSVSIDSSNEAVAFENDLVLLPLDGIGSGRIWAQGVGETDLTFRYFDLPVKTIHVVVQAPASAVPTLPEILQAGYGMTGTARATTCGGQVPDLSTPTATAASTVIDPATGATHLRLTLQYQNLGITSTLTGPFDPVTGRWTANGQVNWNGPARFQEIDGTWGRNDQGRPRFTGVLKDDFGALTCHHEWDVQFTRVS